MTPCNACNDNASLRAALRYAERGWAVLACVPLGKRPLTARGVWGASRDQEAISQWWTCWPNANLGIATGAVSGLVVLDVDGKNGEQSLDALQKRNSPLPRTLEARTGGGGRHIVLGHPGLRVRNSVGLLGSALDVRADGGYVVAAPSRLRSGHYEWRDDPFGTPIAPAPDWLVSLLRREHVVPQPKCRVDAQSFSDVRDPCSYVLAALVNEIVRVATALVGHRNNTLNRAAFAIGRFVRAGLLERDMAVRFLRQAALGAGLERAEVDRTLRSGLGAGDAKEDSRATSAEARLRLLWTLPLSSRAKLLLSVLDSHANSSGWAWPSWDTLCRESSFASRETLATALQEVVPFVEVRPEQKGRGRPHNCYRILWDRVKLAPSLPLHASPHLNPMEGLLRTATVLKSPPAPARLATGEAESLGEGR